MASSSFKLLLVGDGNTGKSTYVDMLLGGPYKPDYVATLGVKVSNVTVRDAIFNIWDTAGQTALLGIKEGYYSRSRCCIVFCDTTPRSEDHIPQHIQEVKRLCGDIPIVIVRNKTTAYSRSSITIDEVEYPLFTISCKESVGLLEPLEHLIDVLTS